MAYLKKNCEKVNLVHFCVGKEVFFTNFPTPSFIFLYLIVVPYNLLPVTGMLKSFLLQKRKILKFAELVDLDDLPIVWKIYPLKENKGKSVALVLFLVLVILLVQVHFGQLGFTLLATVLLGGSLLRYFLPTEYRLNAEGIEISFMGRTNFRKWTEFGCFYVCKNGVQLSTFSKPDRLDSFRGHFILLGNEKDRVISFIKGKLNESK